MRIKSKFILFDNFWDLINSLYVRNFCGGNCYVLNI